MLSKQTFAPKHWRTIKHLPSVTMANFCRGDTAIGKHSRISGGRREMGGNFK